MSPRVRERLKEIFEITVESDFKFDGPLENINYYNLFCKAAAQENLYRIMGNNVCMFNYKYEDNDSVLIIFYIPINSAEIGAKNVAERVMEIVEEIELCFITLDHLRSQEVKDDKFVYITAIKRI